MMIHVEFTTQVNSQIKFKTTVLKSSLCDYSGAYILAKKNKASVGDLRAITAGTRNTSNNC